MSYKISDAVAMRMIQIFQEAVVFGIDGADLMRQVRLIVDPKDDETLTVDPDYMEAVEKNFQKHVAEAHARSARELIERELEAAEKTAAFVRSLEASDDLVN